MPVKKMYLIDDKLPWQSLNTCSGDPTQTSGRVLELDAGFQFELFHNALRP